MNWAKAEGMGGKLVIPPNIPHRRIGNGMSVEYLQELGRPHIVSEAQSWNIAEAQSSKGITSNGKTEAKRCEESDGVIVPMIARTA